MLEVRTELDTRTCITNLQPITCAIIGDLCDECISTHHKYTIRMDIELFNAPIQARSVSGSHDTYLQMKLYSAPNPAEVKAGIIG